jgi:hypothetical protein
VVGAATRYARRSYCVQFLISWLVQRTGLLLLGIAIHAAINIAIEFETALFAVPITIIFYLDWS